MAIRREIAYWCSWRWHCGARSATWTWRPGDEFCVLAPEQDAEAAVTLGERLARAVTEEVATPDETSVGLSVGVVSCPEHGTEAEVLIDGADRAMYRAKAAGDDVALGEPPPAEVAEEANT